jgi:hypothetical protein
VGFEAKKWPLKQKVGIEVKEKYKLSAIAKQSRKSFVLIYPNKRNI